MDVNHCLLGLAPSTMRRSGLSRKSSSESSSSSSSSSSSNMIFIRLVCSSIRVATVIDIIHHQERLFHLHRGPLRFVILDCRKQKNPRLIGKLHTYRVHIPRGTTLVLQQLLLRTTSTSQPRPVNPPQARSPSPRLRDSLQMPGPKRILHVSSAWVRPSITLVVFL